MIGTIRKHSKALWAVIITVVIITFVFWGSNTGQRDRNAREYNFGAIGGEPIKESEYLNARREVNLLYFFSAGDWPGESANRMGFDVNKETYFRLLMLRKVAQAGIHVGDETVVKFAGEFLRRFARGGNISMDAFEKNVLARGGLTLLDFQRYIRNLLAIQQLIADQGIAGDLVTMQEARQLYERETEELATEAVFFVATNYVPGIPASAEALSQFYTNQQARYRIPERMQVSYVAFEITNLVAQAETELAKTNFNEMIEANLQRLGTNYFLEAKTPEEKRAKVREELIKGYAMSLARRQANDFANAVDLMEPKVAANLEKKAAERNLVVKVSEPFDHQEGPKDLKVGEDFVTKAFACTLEEPFAGPLVGTDAAYVIALKGRLPSEIPPQSQIQDRVAADYRHFQAATAARRAGEAFGAAVTNGLASGKTFAAICAEAGVKPVSLPPFSLTTRSVPAIEEHASLQQFKAAAFTAGTGKASQFVPTVEGGFLVFVREKLPIELTKLNAELPEFAQRVRSARQGEAYNQWFQREASRELRDTPALQQKQAAPGAR